MSSPETAQSIVCTAVGALCWRARRGHGSFLTFDLGAQYTDDVGDVGEWHLWVYFGDWILTQAARVIATNWDDHEVIEEAVALFAGTRLLHVGVDARSLDATFDFEHELRLSVGANSDEEELDADWWLLFTPGERVLVVGPGPAWCYQSANEP